MKSVTYVSEHVLPIYPVPTDIGTGYRFTNGYLSNLSLTVGLLYHNIDFVVRSSFNNTLYDFQSTGTLYEIGALYIPYIGLGYSWPILRWLNVGAEISYRYQSGPEELDLDNRYINYSWSTIIDDLSNEIEPITYDVGGLDAKLTFAVHLFNLFN